MINTVRCIKFGEILLDKNRRPFLLCRNCHHEYTDILEFRRHLEVCSGLENLFRKNAALVFDSTKGTQLYGKAPSGELKEYRIYEPNEVQKIEAVEQPLTTIVGSSGAAVSLDESGATGSYMDLIKIEEELLDPRWYTDMTVVQPTIIHTDSKMLEYNELVEAVTPYVQFKENVKTVSSGSDTIFATNTNNSNTTTVMPTTIGTNAVRRQQQQQHQQHHQLSHRAPTTNRSQITVTGGAAQTNGSSGNRVAVKRRMQMTQPRPTTTTTAIASSSTIPHTDSDPTKNNPTTYILNLDKVVKVLPERQLVNAKRKFAKSAGSMMENVHIKVEAPPTGNPTARVTKNTIPLQNNPPPLLVTGTRKKSLQPPPLAQQQPQQQQQTKIMVTIPAPAQTTPTQSQPPPLVVRSSIKANRTPASTLTTKEHQHIGDINSSPITSTTDNQHQQSRPPPAKAKQTELILNKLHSLGLQVKRTTNSPAGERNVNLSLPNSNRTDETRELLKKLQSKGMHVKLLNSSNNSSASKAKKTITTQTLPTPVSAKRSRTSNSVPALLSSIQKTGDNIVIRKVK